MVKYLPRKTKKQRVCTKSWLFFLLLFFLVILLGGLACVVRQSVWDGFSRLNFVFVDREIELVSYDPPSAELTVLLIPSETLLETTRGYRIYRLEAIQALGDLEKKPGLLMETLQENLAVPIDGWVETGDKEQRTEDRKGEILGQLAGQVFGKKVTNLSRWDLFRLWWQVRGLRFDKVKTVDLRQTGVLVSTTLPDSTPAWKIETNKFDLLIRNQKLFLESEIRKEKLNIEVLNGTSHPGLADRGSRIISNLGGTVVWVGNSERQYTQCEVRSGKDGKKSYTVIKITKIFNCDWKERNEEGKADVAIILGESYWQKLNQK